MAATQGKKKKVYVKPTVKLVGFGSLATYVSLKEIVNGRR